MTRFQPPRLADYPGRRADPAREAGPAEPDQAPLVSVVTVVWNGEAFLEQAIESVAAQDYDNLEYILIDGGSTDGTLAIVERHREHMDYWVSEPDRGIYDAMNKGIAAARGQLVKLLNADDLLAPGSVSAAVREYRRVPGPAVITSDLEFIDAAGRALKRIGAARAINPIGAVLHPSWYVDRRLYQEHGLYDTSFRVSADYEMFARLHRRGVRFHHCPTPLVAFRSGGVSQTSTGVFERYEINKRYFSRSVAARSFAMHAYKKLRARALLGVLGEARMYRLRRVVNGILGLRD